MGQRDSTTTARSPIRRHSRSNSGGAEHRPSRNSMSARLQHRMREYYRQHLPVMEPDPNQPSSSEYLDRMLHHQDSLRLPPALRSSGSASPTEYISFPGEVQNENVTVVRQASVPPSAEPPANQGGLLGTSSSTRRARPFIDSEVWRNRYISLFERPRDTRHVEHLPSPPTSAQFAPAYRYYEAEGPSRTHSATPEQHGNYLFQSQTPTRDRQVGDTSPGDERLMLDGSTSPAPRSRTPGLVTDHFDGLGDRDRSPNLDHDQNELHADQEEEQDSETSPVEENWSSLFSTIPPDENLPSASSSFNSSTTGPLSAASLSSLRRRSPSTNLTIPSSRANSADSISNDHISHLPRPHSTDPTTLPRSGSSNDANPSPNCPSPPLRASTSTRRRRPIDYSVLNPHAQPSPNSTSTRRSNNYSILRPLTNTASHTTATPSTRRTRSRSPASHGPTQNSGIERSRRRRSASPNSLSPLHRALLPNAVESLHEAREARDRLELHLNRFEHLDGILSRMERHEEVPEHLWVGAGLTPALGNRVGVRAERGLGRL